MVDIYSCNYYCRCPPFISLTCSKIKALGLAIKLASMDSRFFPKTIIAWNGLAFAEASLLAVFRSNFIRNWRASLPHNTLE